MKPCHPSTGPALATVLALLNSESHPDAEALIARHLDNVERPKASPQLPLLKDPQCANTDAST